MLQSDNASARENKSWYEKTKNILGSRLFFSVVIALFILQAGYIAIKSGFPLAFDENYHLGIIQLHATQWNPFLGHLANSTAKYGALATDPSYLYHYLLSFPYKVLSAVTQNPYFIILSLRFINIGFFVAGLFIFKKVLNYTGASRALVNLTLLGFTVLPLESFTAAQINYDNLVFPITGAALLFCLKFAEKLLKHNTIDFKMLALLISTCLLGAQVKYSFMPIFVAITGFTMFISVVWWIKHKKSAPKKVLGGVRALSTTTKVTLISLLALSGGLFGWRYGYNVVQYGSPLPDCSKVMSVESCMQYGAWARNYQLEHSHIPEASISQAKQFVKIWTYITGNELFSVLDANDGGKMTNPIHQLVWGAKLLFFGGIILLLTQWRRVRQIGYPAGLMIAVCSVYLASLVWQNYSDFTRFGIPIAVQGRYLLPILLLLMVLMAQVYSSALHKTPQLKMAVLAFAMVIGLQGGGVITYVMRTNDTWHWSNTAAVLSQFPDLQNKLTTATSLNPKPVL